MRTLIYQKVRIAIYRSQKTTVTKFCSEDCAKKNYKKRQKEEKITAAILDTNYQLMGPCQNLPTPNQKAVFKESPQKEWITICDLSGILGVAERSLFRAIKVTGFPKLKVGRRLLFNKQQVLDFFTSKSEGI